MNNFFRNVIVFGVLLSAISAVQATPIYVTADFSGGILATGGLANSLGLQRTNTCSGCAAGSLSGNVLFDQSLIPGSSTGTVNIALAAVTGASNSAIFDVEFGSKPLSFVFGDEDVLSGPSIQFENGVFNGFFFVKNFVINEKTYALNMHGAYWTMSWLKNNSSADLVASGYLDVGNQGLTNQTYFELPLPPAELLDNAVPEPKVFALVMVGMLGIFMTHRRKQTYAAVCSRVT
jgi:hypothetical protein